ncbi:GTPase Era [Gammaproteobacteria bacterium]|jgi:GTP-binding protein Era|nr:GTPase Era [Gammaproteobacteria bacterium]MDA7747429.1 GTPase Era [Gammaproteobacteria bacterium]MDA7829934.1 GTPase Era [Gammaproteobacteria bacterium]MDA7844771.1 GTPase Era [Gammaproteobacteria bacterium]MDA9102119.1 GTPase Era [Gammaproteobacteria bacterium]|tara:strand:- start:631 stop:1536 length:906 start_codon:yes stop_codon:yes gene_type:complete
MTKSYCGYISIIGKPNVGKSTILNHILGKKVSITSRKSQTTRNNILGIKTVENKQMIFADTPGMHIKSPKVMNKVLNRSAQSLIDDSDIILFVVQRLTLDEQDMSVLQKLKEAGSKVICVVNKVDQVDDKNKLLPMMARLAKEYSFLDIIPISALNNEGIVELEILIQKYLPENDHIYGEEGIQGAHKDLFMITELIREKIIRMLGDELPHDTFVQVELLEDEESIIKIHSVIYVVRDSQKQIVIGKGGGTLKKIGQQARIELEEYFGKKVFLKTWVKVKKNWNTDSDYIQSLGVGGSYES